MSRASQRLFSPRLQTRLREQLCHWFVRQARPLPWRVSYEPYRVWISEVMLQQTQVDTVLPYYQRWMERFPTLSALAEASEEAILKSWEGLGYYSRARNLHKAARRVMEHHGGHLPRDPARMLELPGVGRYTAGAVASIAYGLSEPLVDGNVGRVLGRLVALEFPARSAEGQERLWQLAEALVPPPGEAIVSPRNFNQGMMELGALVCRARKPLCTVCPLAQECAAHQSGTPERWPPPSPRRDRPESFHALLLIEHQGARLLRRRGAGGLWGGLWELPWLPLSRNDTPLQAAGRLRRALGLPKIPLDPLDMLAHGLTHRRLVFHCFSARIPGAISGLKHPRPSQEFPETRWVAAEELEELPLTRLARKALALHD